MVKDISVRRCHTGKYKMQLDNLAGEALSCLRRRNDEQQVRRNLIGWYKMPLSCLERQAYLACNL